MTKRNLKPEEHPNIVAIFKKLYLVLIPEMYLRDESDIRARGTHSLGDPEKDLKHQSSLARTYRTINEMFELWKDGVEVRLIKQADCETIYHAIEAHLGRWMDLLNKGFAISKTPFDDLLLLDEYANSVYDRAKYVFTAEKLGGLENKTNSLGIFLNPGAMFSRRKGGYRYAHSFKTDREVALETGGRFLGDSERKGFQDQIITMAARYDTAITKTVKKEEEKIVSAPLSIDLKFGNEPR